MLTWILAFLLCLSGRFGPYRVRDIWLSNYDSTLTRTIWLGRGYSTLILVDEKRDKRLDGFWLRGSLKYLAKSKFFNKYTKGEIKKLFEQISQIYSVIFNTDQTDVIQVHTVAAQFRGDTVSISLYSDDHLAGEYILVNEEAINFIQKWQAVYEAWLKEINKKR